MICISVCFRNYIDYVKERADYLTKILPQDRRNHQEREKANQIWRSIRPGGSTKGLFLTFIFFNRHLRPETQFLSF